MIKTVLPGFRSVASDNISQQISLVLCQLVLTIKTFCIKDHLETRFQVHNYHPGHHHSMTDGYSSMM